jgi:hypothetical protein
MSTAPPIDKSRNRTWTEQLFPLLDRYENRTTRAAAYDAFMDMGEIAKLWTADHTSSERYPKIPGLLRDLLREYLAGNRATIGSLQVIAGFADRHEERVEKLVRVKLRQMTADRQ